MGKEKSLKFLSILLSLSVLFSSCGVIFGGSKYYGTVEVKDHPNAVIYANGEKIGAGKAMHLFPRNQSLQIRIEEEGCPSQTKNYYRTFRGGNFILSVLCWGIIGIAVDLGTGASYKPNHRQNNEVQRMTDKNFLFTVEYQDCDSPSSDSEEEFDYAK